MGFDAYGPRITLGAGAIGGFPQRNDVVANILACPFTTDILDDTTNHTLLLGTNAALEPNTGYNDETMLFMEQGDNNYAVKTTGGEDANAIGGTDPVTFGAFMQISYWYTNSHLLTSSASDGDTNYGLTRETNGQWSFRGKTLAGEGVSWINMGDPRPVQDTDSGSPYRWFHVIMRINASPVDTGDFFWNGTKIWSGDIGTAGRKTAAAGDIFQLNAVGTTTPNFSGRMNNVFVSDQALSDVAIKQLSDESFGHASPWTPGGI